MNYYERHIGDYLKDTAHLSLLEHGVYGRLLDVYYTRESAIPDAQAARLIGARSKDEAAALKAVLTEFFTQDDEGWSWIHSRCEREISRYQDKQRKAAASANARWNKPSTQTERNANASPDAMRTHSDGNAHQTPDTSNQSPDPNTHTESIPQVMARAPSLAGQVCFAMKARGITDVNPGHMDLLNLIEAGATLEEFEGAADESAAKRKGFAYAIGTVKRRRQEAASAPAMHRGAMPQQPQTRKDVQLHTAALMTGQAQMPTAKPITQPETIDVESRLIAP